MGDCIADFLKPICRGHWNCDFSRSHHCCRPHDGARNLSGKRDLLQIGGVAGVFLIDMDTLSIEQDNIPDGGYSDVLERESGEVELPLANAMYQLDA